MGGTTGGQVGRRNRAWSFEMSSQPAIGAICGRIFARRAALGHVDAVHPVLASSQSRTVLAAAPSGVAPAFR